MKRLTHRARLTLMGITMFLVLLGYQHYAPEIKSAAFDRPAAKKIEPSSPAAKERKSSPLPKAAENSKPVEVFPAMKQELSDSVEVLGNAKANESVDISSNVSETIREIHFSDGQYVLKGDILAILEQSEEQAQLKAAELQLAEHERELKRIKRLLKNKAASKRDADERKTLVEVARQNIEEIKARIADRTIKAPFDGVLGIRQVSVGALVGSGDVLTTIDDINRMKLDFYVPSVFLPQLKSGNQVKAKAEALDNRIFEGKIDTINTRIDAATRSVLVRAVIPNPDLSLKPGLLMKINLIRNKRKALVVPEEALIQRGRRFFVLVVDEENIVHEREIATGKHYPAKIEATDGLNEGEFVVVRGIHTVRDGQAVSILKTWDEIRKPMTGEL